MSKKKEPRNNIQLPNCNLEENRNEDIFEKMEKHNNDPFWKEILENFSKRKYPKGFIVTKDTLKYGNRVCKLTCKPDKALEKLKKFMNQVLGVCSDRDIVSIKKNSKNTCYEKWTDITRKPVKDTLLYNYLEKLSDENSLDNRKMLYTKALFFLYLNGGLINKDNIVISNNEISHIKGVNFIPETCKFYVEEKSNVKNRNM